jgi:starch synthase
LLHPSRFEPCGLTQLYAMRYGTLPVVTRVGGLTDTVVNAGEQTLRLGTATGFVFQYPNAQAMLACVDRALALYDQPLAWRKVQYQAMSRDFGWDVSAQRYLALYNKLVPDGVQIDVTMDADPLLKTAVR